MVKVTANCCRVCLNTKIVQNEHWRSITEVDDFDKNLTILEKMHQLCDIRLETDSDYAQLICHPCFIKLKIAYDFRIACRASEKLIMKMQVQYQKEVFKENLTEEKDVYSEKTYERSEFYQDNEAEDASDMKNDFSDIKVEISAVLSAESSSESNEDEEKYDPNENYLSNEDNSAECAQDICEDSVQLNVDNLSERNPKQKASEVKKRKFSAQHKYVKSNCEEKNFVCELCGNVYKRRTLLTDHMRWHTGSKDFKCEICGKAFLLNTYLARHVRTHTGIRNYKCSFCSRTFYTNGLKRAHEKVHTGERCYKCELCTRSFSYSQSLQRHMLVHSGVKPHKCEDCGKEFRQESHLKQHLATNIHQSKQQEPKKTKLNKQ